MFLAVGEFVSWCERVWFECEWCGYEIVHMLAKLHCTASLLLFLQYNLVESEW